MKVVILAAGFGSRLWPLSTSEKPKQFLPLIDNESLLHYTYTLVNKIFRKDDIYVLTLNKLANLVTETLPEIETKNIIQVPARHGTLPHTIFALNQLHIEPGERVVFKSVDLKILNEEEFIESFKQSLSSIGKHNGFTLFCAEQSTYVKNYGYCSVDDQQKVTSFIEKPSRSTFEHMRKNGPVLSSQCTYAISQKDMRSELLSIEDTYKKVLLNLLESEPDTVESNYMQAPVLDISRYLFQRAQNMYARPISCDYIDLGTYESIYQLNSKDQNDNVLIGDSTGSETCKKCLIINNTQSPLIVNALSDAAVVATANGLAVSPLNTSNEIGALYKGLIGE